ncbi:hypothetical protein HDE_05312 [Halotydeus destructor]|nr:hypothetical protein HDE_05312 [Halotydeus destructor]
MSSDSSSSSVTGSASGSESDTEGSSKCSWESKEGESEEEENEDELASHELPVVAPAPVEQVQEVYKEEEHYDYQYPIAEVFERFKRKDKNLLLAMERPRLMPSASKEHQEIIERLLEDNYIRTNSGVQHNEED